MRPGEILAGKYRLEKRLGIGGMGEVWKASHTGTGREFAVKLLHAHAATSPMTRQRFSREAQASSKINHPSVIDVLDVGEAEDGSLYLVMELLDGVTLDDVLHGQTPISVADFLTIMLDTVRALGAAHAVGVVHRDVKPANIFLHRDRATGLYAPKVLDFGISKFAGNEGATRVGAVVGSPRYMSPEQTRSSTNVDYRSDLWSLGVVLFEGLTGTFPHEGDSFSSLVVSICTEPPLSIDRMAPHLPESLRSIVRDCLKPLESRLSSANELAARLEAVLQDPSLSRVALPPAQHPASEAVKTVSALRIRPAAIGAPPSRPSPAAVAPAPPSTASPPSTSGSYAATAQAATSGTFPANAPASTASPSSGAFIPTAQTLPLSAVMQLQEQLQEHLKAQAAQAGRGRGGGTLALPASAQFPPADPLKSTASSMAGDAPPPTARSSAIPAQVQATAPLAPPTLSPIVSPTLTDFPQMGPGPGSGKKLRVLLVVLTLVLIGIVIALVSTVRSS